MQLRATKVQLKQMRDRRAEVNIEATGGVGFAKDSGKMIRRSRCVPTNTMQIVGNAEHNARQGASIPNGSSDCLLSESVSIWVWGRRCSRADV
jgi:hypothetical protein